MLQIRTNLQNLQPIIQIRTNLIKFQPTSTRTFQIGLHVKDLEVLSIIQSYFGGVGGFTFETDSVKYRVSRLDDILTKILPHFDIYPLITQKLGPPRLYFI